MQPQQLPLFSPERVRAFNYPFPSTRYQGSKRKLVSWIWDNVYHLEFETVLDVFGGTGVVSHLFKNAGKQVIYNDSLAFNHAIGLALIENDANTLSQEEAEQILNAKPDVKYPSFIQNNFQGIYFTEDENAWLDRVIYNINHYLDNPYKQALARFAVFQACIVKRPYNLFHRANLYMRTAQVERSFGNKTTWDTSFETHFRNFLEEGNKAVFDNGRNNKAIQHDAFDTPIGVDLVYMDPPYLNKKGVGVDYHGFYHFLEGIMQYDDWGELIDYKSKHRRLTPQKSPWYDASKITDAFERIIERHRESIIVVSYRSDGIPSKEKLNQILLKYKKHVVEATLPKQYVLSPKKSHELLLVAT